MRCKIGPIAVWIGRLQMEPGSTIAHVGDVGVLVLLRVDAHTLGLAMLP